jgi:hypothetical protein
MKTCKLSSLDLRSISEGTIYPCLLSIKAGLLMVEGLPLSVGGCLRTSLSHEAKVAVAVLRAAFQLVGSAAAVVGDGVSNGGTASLGI